MLLEMSFNICVGWAGALAGNLLNLHYCPVRVEIVDLSPFACLQRE